MIKKEFMDILNLIRACKENGFVFVDIDMVSNLSIALTTLDFSFFVDDEIFENKKALIVEWDKEKTFQENSKKLRRIKNENI